MGYGRRGPKHASRVLVVADDEGHRQDFARLLRPQGFIVDLVSGHDEAVELAAESPFSWMVVDGSTGENAARGLWQRLSQLQPACQGLLLVPEPPRPHGQGEQNREAELPTRDAFLTVLPPPWKNDEIVELACAATASRGCHPAPSPSSGTGTEREPEPEVRQLLLLLLEDNDFDAAIITRELQHESQGRFQVVRATCLAEARELLEKQTYEVMLSDLSLPDASGLASVNELQLLAPDTPLLVVTAADDEHQALAALQSGAQDYLLKGQFGDGAVMRAVRYAVERKRIEQRLNHLAHHDQLTGLCNRTALNTRLPQALARADRSGKQTALVLVDLDHFKAVNDTYGHQMGDRLLVEVAQRLQSSTRLEDTVARLGGDEFAILLEDLEDVDGARRVGQRVVNAFATPVVIDGNTLAVTASLGIALCPLQAGNLDELTRRADDALYKAKALGKNAFHIAAQEHTPESERTEALTRTLLGALDAGRFSLVTQPLCRLSDRVVVAHEAFLRLLDEQGTQVGARELLPLLDETGDIVVVGRWVLDRACELVSKGQAPDGRISVNVSVRELDDPGFVESVQTALQTHRVAGSRLEIEIAEQTLEQVPACARTKLPLLAAMGVALTVDDYGLGHTNLPELAELPISSVKLHPALLQELNVTRRLATLKAVVSSARCLGWTTVAKCVENAAQWAALRQSGCELAQGRLVGEPSATWEMAHLPASPSGPLQAKDTCLPSR